MRYGGLTLPRAADVRETIAGYWGNIDASPRAARLALAAAWGVTRLALFLGLVIGHNYCDPQFYDYAGRLAAGQWPYRDYPVEYPPIAILLILLPALPLLPFARIAPRLDPAFTPPIVRLPHPDPLRYGAYGISFGIEMLIVDALTLWLIQREAPRLVPRDAYGLRSGLRYIALVFASGALLQKFDLAAGTLCLVAVLAVAAGRDSVGWGALGLSALVKGYPILAVPALVAYRVVRSRRAQLVPALRVQARRLAPAGTALAVVIAAFTLLVVVIAGWSAVMRTVLYHTGRATEIESLYATIQMGLGWLPGLGVHTIFNPADQSRIVAGPLDRWTGAASLLSVGAFLLLTYAGLWLAVRRAWHTPRVAAADAQVAAVGVAATLLAFIIAFRALPAHYLLAVLPLAAVIRLPQPRAQALWLAGVLGVALLGQVLAVPAVWQALVLLQPWAVASLALRNMAWLLAFGALLMTLWKTLWQRQDMTTPRDDPARAEVGQAGARR
jgi:hypothetical protein